MKYKNISSLSAFVLLDKTTAQKQVDVALDGTSTPLIKKEKTNRDLLGKNKRKLALNCLEKLFEFEQNKNTVLGDGSFSYLLKEHISENEKMDKTAYCRFPILPPHLKLNNPLTIIDFDKDKKLKKCVEEF